MAGQRYMAEVALRRGGRASGPVEGGLHAGFELTGQSW
jgi:hypothetical protein